MNATDKAEALRLEREVRENLAALNDTKAHSCAHVPIVFAMAALDALRSLLSAQEAEPSAEQWRQAIREEVSEVVVNSAELLSIEQRARELARKGVGNG